MKYLILLALAVFSGCATDTAFREVATSYVGKDSDYVVKRLGAPTSVFAMNSGNKILTFDRAAYAGSPYTCVIRFEIDKNSSVIEVNWQGNSCHTDVNRPSTEGWSWL